MASPVEQIKDRISIEEVVASYMELKTAGSYLKGLCPFHQEKTPSFFVSPDRGSFCCYGCGVKGDIFTFVERIEGLDFPGALKLLGERAGVEISKARPGQDQERIKLFEITEAAGEFFRSKLSSAGSAQQYLRDRGLKPRTIIDWSLGLAPDQWQDLKNHLSGLGYELADMLAAGLVKQKDQKVYDTFRRRVIFPVWDTSGRMIGFSGRLFPERVEDRAPKYLNSPDTLIYNKSEVLFGLDRAKELIRRNDYAILVEGQFDLILSHQAGLRNTVAASGTALTGAHLDRLKRLSANLILAFDPDPAGLAAAQRAAILALNRGFNVKLANLPAGQDPADLIGSDSGLWRRALAEAKHPVEFWIAMLQTDQVTGRSAIDRVEKEIFPLLAAMPRAMERTALIGELSASIGLSRSAVEEDLTRFETQSSTSHQVDQKWPTDSSPQSQVKRSAADPLRTLTALYIWQKHARIPKITIDQFDQKLETHGLRSVVEEQTTDLSEDEVFGEEIKYEDFSTEAVDKAIDELILYYRIRALEREFEYAKNELYQAERAGVEADVRTWLAQCQNLSRQLNDLKSGLSNNVY